MPAWSTELRALADTATAAVAQPGCERTPPTTTLAHDDARAEAARQVRVLAPAEHRRACLLLAADVAGPQAM